MRRTPIAILVAVSLGLHLLLALVVGRYTTELKDKLASAELATVEPGPDVSFAYACSVDIGAMVSARLAYCATPMAGEGCADAALDRFESELILCEMQQPDMPALSQVDPSDVQLMSEADIAKIKPAPLLPTQEQKLAKKEEKKVEDQAEAEKRKQTRPSASAQVVEITQPELEMRPDNARYLSEYDSKVDKETVARASTDKMVARPGKDTEPKKADDTPKVFRKPEDSSESGEVGRKPGKAGRSGEQGLLAMRGARDEAMQRMTRGILSGSVPGMDGELPASGEQSKPDIRPPTGKAGGEGGEGGDGGDGGSRIPNLRPSDDVLKKMVGGGSVDKLDGVESGETTALNSRQWKYASFFNRMKRRVAQNWNPANVYTRRDPNGRVYGSKDRLTVLKVSLTPTGRLAKAVVLNGSGVDFLDDEAVRAFRAAQPFPNPPSALVDKGTGYITFSFGFHFQINGPNDAWWKFKRF